MAKPSKYRLGVDVGGTNTDAVLLDIAKNAVVASFKHVTTPEITSGIEKAVQHVLENARVSAGSEGILSLNIGTTHFVNAVVQLDSRCLEKVAVIRLAAPYTTECPSFIDFPEGLKSIMNGYTAVIDGGLQIDGRVINDLQEEQIVEQARVIHEKGLRNVVVAGVYSPLDVEGKQEYRAREILRRELGDSVNVVFGHVGFLERENASILNASIMSFAQRTIRSYKRAMKRLGLCCPLYLTQNDGTLITAEEAAHLPIKTFSSGATNSMRGASFLGGLDINSAKPEERKSVIAVDIGGTTTDLSRDAIVFGGTQLTTTDIAVRSGSVALGDLSKVSYLHEEVVVAAEQRIKHLLENVVDRMKTSQEDCDLLLVGGGSVIAPQSLRGVKSIIVPKHHEVANAVGAAIASVSGEIDMIEILEGRDLTEVVNEIKERAMERTVVMGATVGSVRIVDVKILPVQYVTNQATRIVVRAAGELSQDTLPQVPSTTGEIYEEEEEQENRELEAIIHKPNAQEQIDYTTYRPKIVGDIWILSETDLFFIMEGCGILGTGGGGSPYPSYLACRQILRDGGSISVIDHTSLNDDDFVARGGFMGSPSVCSEKITSGEHLRVAGIELGKYCGITKFAATLSDEIGGGNGMQSLQTARYYGVPSLDGDLMGRAYPMLNQMLPAVYDRPNSLVPCSLNDGDGNTVILATVKNDRFVEAIMRIVTTEFGSSAALCLSPLAVRDARDFGVTRSQSQAWWLGRAISICRQTNNMKGIPDAILKLQNGACLFVGKIIDVRREVRAGFTWGEVRIARLREDELENTNGEFFDSKSNENPNATMLIPFQNENLCAYMDCEDGPRKIVASVPDLITILDSQSGSHLGTPEYTYGLRVTVMVLAGHPLWRTEMGLKVGGPAAFGLQHEYTPIGDYIEPRSFAIALFASSSPHLLHERSYIQPRYFCRGRRPNMSRFGDCNLTVDMILQSSDGESFGAHQFNLECYSAGFPPAASTITNSPEDMTVELTETAVVLRLMLQYMHNVRQPDLSKVSFLVLSALAEAVEKYLIFPAMDVCKVFMELSKDDYPSEVLMYAAKHDYMDLADKAARLTIGKSDSEIMSAAERLQAPDIIILKWVRMHSFIPRVNLY
ncbi:hypothetical protein NLJ89_g2022 [Agrocybe chaxingu]|uniref:Hydantoinase/oxoprolinase n=1 Tax=Agrocybe chaxingu TaxID=84603 RepID=A0A9W8MWV8_9AGAR|nr:hypothetical protein NLJ89_g2022 [Agrocybe chaxingu]